MLKRTLYVNLLLIIISTILTLLFAELLVRIFSPQSNIWDYKIPLVEENFRMTCIPNHRMRHINPNGDFSLDLIINKYGFRDKNDFINSKKKDIAILGDSFSFGYGVKEEERFGNVLQELFNDSLIVYNLGIPKAHIINAKKNLDYAIMKGLDTKRLIFSVCMEKDLLDYGEVIQYKPSKLKSIKNWFHENSSLYAFVGRKLHANKSLENALNKLGIMNDNSIHPLYFTPDKAIMSSVNQLDSLLKDFENIIVIIPSRLNWVNGHKTKANEVHQRFIEELNKKSFNVLDIKPVFDSLSNHPLQDFHFPNDGHWNSIGHQIVGIEIYRMLHK